MTLRTVGAFGLCHHLTVVGVCGCAGVSTWYVPRLEMETVACSIGREKSACSVGRGVRGAAFGVEVDTRAHPVTTDGTARLVLGHLSIRVSLERVVEKTRDRAVGWAGRLVVPCAKDLLMAVELGIMRSAPFECVRTDLRLLEAAQGDGWEGVAMVVRA